MMIDKTKMTGLYNGRYDEFGRDIRTVGWGSKRDQILRFDVLLRGLNPKGKTILDVGCGLGDLIPFLNERTAGDYYYVGVDIADRLIEDARKTFSAPNFEFHVGDVFSDSLREVDISVLSGALSFRIDGIEQYAYDTMRKMFELSREVACLNFLTKYVDYELEKNQHYHPEVIFSQAKGLSRRVNLIHDYRLYEFTVQIFK